MLPTRLALLFSLAAAAACSSVPENTSENPTANFVQVSPGVYRGARPDRAALERMAGMSIRTIINLEDDAAAIEEERVWAEELGLTQVVTSMTGLDNPSNREVAGVLGVLADKQNHPVFVHCMKGMDRTGAIIALHRIFNEGWSASEARAEMMHHGFNNVLLTMREYFDLKSGIKD